jgi:hypothetical protein
VPIYSIGENKKEASMGCSLKKCLKVRGDVALVEEQIYFVIPQLVIETTYAVTSSRDPEGLNFSTLTAAETYFQAEVARW